MDKSEKNPYRELMEQVNLTPEARERILTNVQQADLSPQPEQKIVPFRPQKQTWRRWASLAACLVVVVAVLVAVPSSPSPLSAQRTPRMTKGWRKSPTPAPAARPLPTASLAAAKATPATTTSIPTRKPSPNRTPP